MVTALILFDLTMKTQSITLKFLCRLILVLLGCGTLLSLGFWQLYRADYKRSLLKSIEQQQKLSPVNFNKISQISPGLAYRKTTVIGEFDNEHQILVDNRFYKHRYGFEVITPLSIGLDKPLLLVNRGWIPAKKMHKHLPKISAVMGNRRLTGFLDMQAERGFVLANTISADSAWPLLIQKIDFAKISEQLGREVYPVVLVVDEETNFAFKRHWHPVTMSPARHTAYAVQWFGLAIVLLIGFIVLQTKRNHE